MEDHLDASYANESADPAGSSSPSGRRQQVRHACLACRQRKTKCNAARPQCDRCGQLGLSCQYSVPSESVSKMEQVKLDISNLEAQNHALYGIFSDMRSAPYNEAFGMLDRLRKSDGPPGMEAASAADAEAEAVAGGSGTSRSGHGTSGKRDEEGDVESLIPRVGSVAFKDPSGSGGNA